MNHLLLCNKNSFTTYLCKDTKKNPNRRKQNKE